jgi:hypothetical protein
MNTLIEFFQGLAAQVPDLLQPFIIAVAGAIPFIEGEVSSIIGVWAGMNPVLAGIAGAIGNFVCVTVIVAPRRPRPPCCRRPTEPEARTRVHRLRDRHRSSRSAGRGFPRRTLPPRLPPPLAEGADDVQGHGRLGEETKPDSKGRAKFKRFLTRFGVPGASLLGPLAIPTQITSTILVSAGVKTSWILLWQGIAVIAWTTLTTLIATGSLALLAG